jgi:1-aminocyclopropane-1-carboxylate deaminase/D-cysteine desulfhydrase-like pyridoxal-dependent ACC family enzyme
MALFQFAILVLTAVIMKLNNAVQTNAKNICSRVSKHIFRGIPFYIKRDDEKNITGDKNQNIISGNKTRKLLELSKKKPFPKVVVSYGGAQSNSMLAIAKVVANSDHGKFLYLTKALPKFLKNTPNGNLKVAISLGMQVIHIFHLYCSTAICTVVSNNTVAATLVICLTII